MSINPITENASWILCEDLPRRTTSFCDTFIMLQTQETFYTFLLGIIIGALFVFLVFMFTKILAKHKSSKEE